MQNKLGLVTGTATEGGNPIANATLLVQEASTGRGDAVRIYATDSPSSILSTSGRVTADANGHYSFYCVAGRLVNVRCLDATGSVRYADYGVYPGETAVASAGASTFVSLTDSTSANFPAINTPLSNALAAKAPATGIARTALDAGTQTSLGKADTALQVAPVTSVAGKTGAVVLTAADVPVAPRC